MRRTPVRFALVAPCLLLAACGSKSKEGASAAADPNTVVVDAAGISLGGERLADAPADAQEKVAPLFQKLKDRREEWKSAHPDLRFEGALAVEVGPTITCRAAMSVYLTALFAGYPKLTLKQGPMTIDMPGAIPRPPSPGELLEPYARAPREVFASFQSSGDVDLKPFRCGGAYDVVPSTSFAATVKEWCGESADCLRTLHLRCDAGVPMAKVLPMLDALRKGSAKMELGGAAPDCKEGEGAFAIPEDPWGALPTPAASTAAIPAKKPRPSEIREGAVTAVGLSADEAREAMKAKLPALKACFEEGLSRNPNLQGRVSVRLAVGKKGAVMTASNGGSDLPDSGVVACMVRASATATFPAKGVVATVSYPVMVSPK